MILFYNKKTGNIIGTIDGRVHDKIQMEMSIGNSSPKEDIGRYIIGWEGTGEPEDFEEEVEDFEEIKKGLFKKIKKVITRQREKRIEHNIDKFEILQRFENDTPENPMDYKIENNNLIKK
jgi:hypothetical protein